VSNPKLDKTVISVLPLDHRAEDMKYWLSRTPEERLEALEVNRSLVYGEENASSRLQRLLEVIHLADR
jgi:hypothetical protein